MNDTTNTTAQEAPTMTTQQILEAFQTATRLVQLRVQILEMGMEEARTGSFKEYDRLKEAEGILTYAIHAIEAPATAAWNRHLGR